MCVCACHHLLPRVEEEEGIIAQPCEGRGGTAAEDVEWVAVYAGMFMCVCVYVCERDKGEGMCMSAGVILPG